MQQPPSLKKGLKKSNLILTKSWDMYCTGQRKVVTSTSIEQCSNPLSAQQSHRCATWWLWQNYVKMTRLIFDDDKMTRHILMTTRWQDLYFDDDKMTRLTFWWWQYDKTYFRWWQDDELYFADNKMTRFISWWRQDDKTYILMMIRWQDLYFDTIAIDEDEMLKRPRP